MKKLIILWAMILFLLNKSMAQQKLSTDKLDTFIGAALKKFPEVPGLSLAIVKGDQVYYTQAYGQADPQKGVKATPQIPYYTASVTKAFVGLLATILASEGKIKLDVPISEYKPFKNFKNRSLFANVTIRDLLSHQSGLANDELEYVHAYTGNHTQADNLRLLEQKTVALKEGKVFEYTNLGYNLLDILLQEELGENWKTLLAEKVLNPLGLTHTSAYMSDAQKKNWGVAWPYMVYLPDHHPARVYFLKSDDIMHAAGGLITSADDAAKWILCNIHEGKIAGQQVFSKKLMKTIQTPYVFLNDHSRIFTQEGYGLGWSIGKYDTDKVLFHFGGYAGYFAHISFMLEQKIGLAVFVNESLTGWEMADMISHYVYRSLLGKAVKEEELLTNFEEVIKTRIKRLASAYQQRAKRTWQLSQPLENYTGTYLHEDYGTLKVSIKDQQPFIEIAGFHGTATPFTRENTMRVELLPLSGKILQFELNQHGIAQKVIYHGGVFTRKDS